MSDGELQIDVPADRAAVVFRRFVDAPPELVFDVWTLPDHLRRWWGPRGFELVVCEVDLRTNGRYRLVQRAPDGQEHGFHGEYLDVERPTRLRRTFIYDRAPEHAAFETVTFQADGSGTLVNSESLFPSPAARQLYTRAGMQHGLRESHQRLDDWLDTIQNQPDRRSDG